MTNHRLIRQRRRSATVALHEAWQRKKAPTLTSAEAATLRSILDASTTWYHGGKFGLRAGDILLPAGITGSDPRGERRKGLSTEGVFISKLASEAKFYATKVAGGGAIYVVEPIGKIAVDPFDIVSAPVVAQRYGIAPEEVPNLNYYCQSARVVAEVPISNVAKCNRAIIMPRFLADLNLFLAKVGVGEER